MGSVGDLATNFYNFLLLAVIFDIRHFKKYKFKTWQEQHLSHKIRFMPLISLFSLEMLWRGKKFSYDIF